MKASELPPALREFGLSKETGQSGSPEIPVPKEIARLRELEAKRIAALEEADFQREIISAPDDAEKGPDRLIGPRNPEHPAVNTDKGGRGQG